MSLQSWSKRIQVLCAALLISLVGFANEALYKQARTLQRERKYDEAIEGFKSYLSQSIDRDDLTEEQLFLYTEALMQLMNTYQSKGEPEACVSTLQEVFSASPTLQKQCQRDYYSILGYALSRTERMKEAEEMMLKALTLPMQHATPERYFRDYAYAAAVFYSNPHYQDEVVEWCQEAMKQAELCKNTSGKQWVTAMLGTLYKRNGHLNKALELYQQSKEEALQRKDDLGVLNSLHTLTDLFLYWDIPEYADLYATEALRVERGMSQNNPMVSAQTYINKGRAKYQLGEADSVAYYTEEARKRCQALPYNSGLVDVELLHGTYLTERGGDSLQAGISELQHVVQEATPINRAKAYHQLAQTYLKANEDQMAEAMLDSMYTLLTPSGAHIQLNYEPIINHYLKTENTKKAEQYVRMMLEQQQAFKEKKLNYNLIETIVDLKTAQKRQELKIAKLTQANQRLWLLICIAVSLIAILAMAVYLINQKKKHSKQLKQADERLDSLTQKLHQSNTEKEMRAQEIKEFLKDKDNRQELETLTPSILQTDGETKFRQCFELLYPLFLPRLREKVPSITRREELLSMLIVLKQDNKRIAELLAVAPRSVLMLRHRFRQKIGMDTEFSLENFIENIIGLPDNGESQDK
ncbi:MAG: hypothetical protein IKY64_04540 [Bacteroidaceae bacterium]|nr:hypothetical protein [Bacteroidaceae bacterium]